MSILSLIIIIWVGAVELEQKREMNQPRKQIHQDGINALYKIELYIIVCVVCTCVHACL